MFIRLYLCGAQPFELLVCEFALIYRIYNIIDTLCGAFFKSIIIQYKFNGILI